MNIGKPKGKLKETSIQSIVDEKLPRKQQVSFMNASIDTTALGILYQKEAAAKLDNLSAQEKRRREYNEQVNQIDPDYAALQLRQNAVIVRHFLRPEELTLKGGLVAINTAMVGTKAKGTGFDGDKVRDPWNFHQLAVIVAVPDYYRDSLPVGTLVAINAPQIMTYHNEVVDYQNSFKHPRNQAQRIPTDPADPDFGYRLIPENAITVIVERHAEILEPAKK